MENSKSIDIIIENFSMGQKKGRIFSYVLTLTVAIGILFTVFLGMNLISKKYSLIRQEVINKNAEIEKIRSDITANKIELKEKEIEIESLKKALKIDNKLK
jgi:hypothetical protein